jgi:uncharacterized protein
MSSPFMNYFHTGLTNRGFLTVKFNFDYMNQKRKVPDPQPKLQARYRAVIGEVLAANQPKRLIIGGKSMGGRVASYIAGDIPEVRGLVFLGYPLHPPGKQDQLRDAHLYKLSCPMLFISGTKDPFAERALLENVVRQIGAHATLRWIEGGDHSLRTSKKDEQSLATAADTIEKWIHAI